jgi:hypothetical protein
MKVLTCSACWLPTDIRSPLCRSCKRNAQSAAFAEALTTLQEKKPLDARSLYETLSPRDLTVLLLSALRTSHPVAACVEKTNTRVWPEILQEIRFHKNPHSNTCAAFRVLLDKNLYNEITIPEECCECMYAAVTRRYSSYCNLAIGHLFYSDKEKMVSLFKRHLQTKGGRESLLNYINCMLWISNSVEFITPLASRRVIDTLLEANSQKEWILEELVLRPENYKFFLASPPVLPGNYTETMFDHFQDFDVWWNWWQRIVITANKKIEFRFSSHKEELMATTWDASRVREWCLDTEQLNDVNRYFGRYICN